MLYGKKVPARFHPGRGLFTVRKLLGGYFNRKVKMAESRALTA